MKKLVLILTFALLVTGLGLGSQFTGSSSSTASRKLASLDVKLPMQKAHSDLQLEVRASGPKDNSNQWTGVIQSPHSISEDIHYKWILPERLNNMQIQAEGSVSGLDGSEIVVSAPIDPSLLNENESLIFTAYYMKNGKKRGNVASLKKNSTSKVYEKTAAQGARPKIIF